MTVAELKNNISKNLIERIYLFSGNEVGEKNQIIDLIEKKLFPNGTPTKYTFYCDNDLDPHYFIETVNSNLLFSDNKLIFLKFVEKISKLLIELLEDIIIPKRCSQNYFGNNILSLCKTKEQKDTLTNFYEYSENGYYTLKKLKVADTKKLVSLFESISFCGIPDNSYIIMLNETNEKIPAELTNILNQKQNIIFWEMFDNQKPAWIRGEFKKYNLFIEESAIEFIINTVENNKMSFESEIQKISMAYPGIKNNNKNVVTREIIEEFLYHSKDESAFTLYSALIYKDIESALDILNKLIYVKPEILLSGLVVAHKKFHKIFNLYENENKSLEDIFSSLFINSKKIKDEYTFGLKNYSFKSIVNIFSLLSELDYYLKVFPKELKLIKLQEFVFKFISESKNHMLSGELITFIE